jgi:hypothetical protein
MQSVSKQRLGKHAYTTIGLLLETVFLFVQCTVVIKKTIGTILLVEGWQFI